jgi:hypothetical protein
MELKCIAEVFDWLAIEPLSNNVKIGDRVYYMDTGGNICIKGVRTRSDKVNEDIFLKIETDILLNAILIEDAVDFNGVDYKYRENNALDEVEEVRVEDDNGDIIALINNTGVDEPVSCLKGYQVVFKYKGE